MLSYHTVTTVYCVCCTVCIIVYDTIIPGTVPSYERRVVQEYRVRLKFIYFW